MNENLCKHFLLVKYCKLVDVIAKFLGNIKKPKKNNINLVFIIVYFNFLILVLEK